MGHTVRISDSSRDLLRHLAEREGAPMQAVLEKALESYRRQRFLEQVNQGYADLRSDPEAAAAFDQELSEWDRATDLPSETPPKSARGRARPRRRRPA